MKEKILFLVGPTASGKTAAAVIFAKRIGAEIISCDSMQVYKGMDIITSKPFPALRKKVPHYLIGVVSLAKDYDVTRFRRAALNKAKDILKRGKIPLFVGGTGLYMSVLLDGIFKTKASDPRLRERLYKLAQNKGSLYLYNRLLRVDPAAALKIHPNDTRRLIRALEVFTATGKPISELQKKRKGLYADYDVKILCLGLKRERLYRRIEQRVERMFNKGLLDEVRKLLRRKLSRTASAAIGIKELKGYFDGQYDLAEAKELVKLNTRRYAKRQLTWFRKDKRITWVKLTGNESPKETADKLWKKFF
ncbi:MAG: tRNA (adenosine(37)-N6)-dimethylallyltransferase MiaA [Candidatus Omnitrophota bacterium]|nr:tRNA (adenosine(37)-N6)-dimethylallyltransferase MiaA [Candidatus Omnitrophota bacterium]